MDHTPQQSKFRVVKRNIVNEKTKAHLAMFVFSALVSTSFTIGRAITFALEPAALTFLRFIMAIAIFAAITIFSKNTFKFPTLKSWGRYFTLAIILVVFFITMFEGLRWTTPLNTAAVFTLVPFLSVIVSFVALRQKLPLIGYISLFIASLAGLWIVFNGNFEHFIAFKIGKGELIFLIGCASYSAYASAVQKLNGGDSLINLTMWTLVAGAVILLIYGWQSITTTQWQLVSPITYLAVGWLALFTTAISFYLIQYASLRLPSINVMAYTLLIPAFVLLQKVANGGAWPNGSVLAALAVLVSAMLVLQRA